MTAESLRKRCPGVPSCDCTYSGRGSGQDRWADSSPQRFLLPGRELAVQALTCPLHGKQLELLLPVHLSAPPPSPGHMPAAAQCPWPCPWLGTQRAGSLENVLTALRRKLPRAPGTPAFGHELRRRRLMALGPKGCRQESQSCSHHYYKVWDLGVKKKSNILPK